MNKFKIVVICRQKHIREEFDTYKECYDYLNSPYGPDRENPTWLHLETAAAGFGGGYFYCNIYKQPIIDF